MTWRLFVTKARNSCHCCFRYPFVGPFVCVLNCYLSVSVLLRCFSVWNNELLCYYYSVGTSQGNKLIRSCSGKSQPQSSYLAEPLWTYPGLKSGIGVRELISSLKKYTGGDGSTKNRPPDSRMRGKSRRHDYQYHHHCHPRPPFPLSLCIARGGLAQIPKLKYLQLRPQNYR